MHLKALILLFCLSVAVSSSGQDKVYLYYIGKYKDIAMQEMQRTGIPASIKLAQALHETDGGTSYLSSMSKNHFGIKCGPDWYGFRALKKDDEYDASGKLIQSCFRVYQSVENSYIAHSQFLRNPEKFHRYGFLFQLDPLDYRQWAIGLKKAGYATNPSYHLKLIEIIETYNLHKYDLMVLKNGGRQLGQ